MKIIKLFLTIGITVLLGLTFLNGKVAPTSLQQSAIRPKPLNYVIYKNETVEDQNKSLSRREINILMDERSFNEDNLVKLYSKLSNKYPSPVNLYVSIKTSFDQIPPPDFPILSGGPDDPEEMKHHRAAFVRRYDGSETIRFTLNPLTNDMKTIIVKEKGK